MKWVTAMLFGAVVAIALPMFFGGPDGVWMQSFAKWWTVRPLHNSPGLLFSIPTFVGTSIALRLFFNWHGR